MQIQFTEEQARELRREASERGISIAALTRQVVDGYFRERTGLTPEQNKQRLLDVLGSFESSHTDVAENHDEHIADIIQSRFA